MKNLTKFSVVALLMLLTASAFAQTQPGVHIIGAVGLNNVNREPQMMTLQGEAGYIGKVLGLTGTYNNVAQKHFTKASSYGVKAYAKFLKVDELHFFVTAGVDRNIKPIDKHITSKWSYKPGLLVAMPIFSHVDAGFGVHEFIYRQERKGVDKERYLTGATLSLAFRL